MTGNRLTVNVAKALAVAVALAGAGAADAATVHVHERDYRLAAHGTGALRPGIVRFDVRNDGRRVHAMDLVRLRGDTTPAQALELLGGDFATALRHLDLLGGAPQIAPGGRYQMAARLRAGRYLVLSDAGDDKPDFARGMAQAFTVRSGRPSHAGPPHVVGSVQLRDFAFGFRLPQRWDGAGWLKVTNTGAQVHEMTLLQLDPGTDPAPVADELRQGLPSGPPPGRLLYPLGGLGAGRTAYVKVDLSAATYVAVSLFPDLTTGKTQNQLGMVATLTVP